MTSSLPVVTSSLPVVTSSLPVVTSSLPSSRDAITSGYDVITSGRNIITSGRSLTLPSSRDVITEQQQSHVRSPTTEVQGGGVGVGWGRGREVVYAQRALNSAMLTLPSSLASTWSMMPLMTSSLGLLGMELKAAVTSSLVSTPDPSLSKLLNVASS